MAPHPQTHAYTGSEDRAHQAAIESRGLIIKVRSALKRPLRVVSRDDSVSVSVDGRLWLQCDGVAGVASSADDGVVISVAAAFGFDQGPFWDAGHAADARSLVAPVLRLVHQLSTVRRYLGCDEALELVPLKIHTQSSDRWH